MTRPAVSKHWLFFAATAVFWTILYFFFLSPEFGSADVYLFKDAGINLVRGEGFRTFATERSASFVPMFYSSYTPGMEWVFALFARFFGYSVAAESIFTLICSGLLSAVFFSIGIAVTRGWLRYAFLSLFFVTFPLNGASIWPDRPEILSLLLLTALAWRLRKPVVSASGVVWLAVISFGAFLMEPIAGVLALFLVAGAWFARPSSGVFSTPRAALVLVLFFAGVFALCMAYLHIDPNSLHRFQEQAREGGFHRTANSHTGDFYGATAANAHSGKVWDIIVGLHFAPGESRAALFETFGFLVEAAIWVAMLLLKAPGWPRSRLLLLVVGLGFFVLSVVLLPLESIYRQLFGALFAMLVALDWAGIRSATRFSESSGLLLVAVFLFALPYALSNYRMRALNRNSYAVATQEAAFLGNYLESHPELRHGVFLVPATHYYLYKGVVGKMTSPHYLTRSEDPAQVSGVVECYLGTSYFGEERVPVTPFLTGQTFKLLVTKKDDVSGSLLGKRADGLNGTWECDIYVR